MTSIFYPVILCSYLFFLDVGLDFFQSFLMATEDRVKNELLSVITTTLLLAPKRRHYNNQNGGSKRQITRGQDRLDYRYHRSGWFVLGRVSSRQGLHGRSFHSVDKFSRTLARKSAVLVDVCVRVCARFSPCFLLDENTCRSTALFVVRLVSTRVASITSIAIVTRRELSSFCITEISAMQPT